MSEPTQYRTREGEMVDEIAQAYYGQTDGTTELILAVNPGLANYELLPAGLIITLPALPVAKETQVAQLWT